MSSIRSSLLLGAGDAAAGGFQVSRSLRFNAADSAYLSRTPASAGNRKTWTWSGWVKRSGLDSDVRLFEAGTSSTDVTWFGFVGANSFRFEDYSSGSYKIQLGSSALYRDVSAWYHLVVAVDTTQATSTDRVKLYVNGTQIVNFSLNTYPSPSFDTRANNTVLHTTGGSAVIGGSAYFNGYLANVQLIDGQQLAPSSFTETDATTGQLIPKTYSGSYGTNGFNLLFADNSSNTASTLGKDTSPNGNNWTPNNLSVTAGAGNDSLIDSPTNYGTDTGVGGEVRGNYATWNAVNKSANTTLSNGNLNATSTVGDWRAVFGTVGMSSGKWYWELTITGASYHLHGIAKQGANLDAFIGTDANGWGYYGSSGTYNNSNLINTSTFASYTTNDVIGVAFDADNGSLYFYKNGTVQNSGSPAYTGLTSGPYFPAVSHFSSTNSDANFGQRAFAYQTPGTNRPASTYKALCTQNLPAPLVTKSNTVMDVALYTGNGGTQSITGLAFSPDLLWIKARSAGYSHLLADSVRGPLYTLQSDGTSAEQSYGCINSFDSAGFTVDLDGTIGANNNGTTFVGWCWDAGTSTVSNTQGSITSQVRANPTAGFSVVTYSSGGSGSTLDTVGHGLGVSPSMVIAKNRDIADSWYVIRSDFSNVASDYLQLNSTAAKTTSGSTLWSLSSTTVGLRQGTIASASNQKIVLYAFAPVVGYSSFGSYTGNGSTDGPFIYTGFRPRWIMIKGTTNTYRWMIIDTTRSTYNQVDSALAANYSDAESTSSANFGTDILSNGFKPRTSGSYTSNSNNGSGDTFIYMAFAESPFQYARAR
jgi:hypothetical protein